MNCIEETRPFERAETLAQSECDATLDLLLHLNEIEGQKLHLDHGYASMFDFATRHLRYSESAAGRRIQVARCLRRFPALVEVFRAREVNLSTVACLSRVIDDENDEQLIARIRGKSQREVERMVAVFRPPIPVRDEVKPIPSAPAGPKACAHVRGARRFESNPTVPGDRRAAGSGLEPTGEPKESGGQAPLAGDDPERDPAGAGGSRSPEAPPRPGGSAPGGHVPEEPRFKIQFSASAEFKEKLDHVRSLLSGRFPQGASLEEIFGAALEVFLDRECPIRRQERRKARRAKRRDPAPGPGLRSEPGRDTFTPDGAARSRRIPRALRDAVHVRDGGQCTFVGRSGRRCSARHGLEIDHVVPFARGGACTLENLRLLCARHNRLEAEREYGTSWMHRFRKHVEELETIAPGTDS